MFALQNPCSNVYQYNNHFPLSLQQVTNLQVGQGQDFCNLRTFFFHQFVYKFLISLFVSSSSQVVLLYQYFYQILHILLYVQLRSSMSLTIDRKFYLSDSKSPLMKDNRNSTKRFIWCL